MFREHLEVFREANPTIRSKTENAFESSRTTSVIQQIYCTNIQQAYRSNNLIDKKPEANTMKVPISVEPTNETEIKEKILVEPIAKANNA